MSQANYEKALKQIETGDLAEALQNLDRLLKKNPKFAPAYLPRASPVKVYAEPA